jgi:GcrA cell cycle regulator
MVHNAEDRPVPHAAALARTRFEWSAASLAILRRRWAEGATARSIAKGLGRGVSRCAVLGKVHRLKLSEPEFKQRRRRKKKARPRRRRAGTPSRRAYHRVTELIAAFHGFGLDAVFSALNAPAVHQHADKAFGPACGLLELNATTCRWPVGEPGEEGFAFCGAAPFKRYPYCIGHCLIAYRPDASESGPRASAPACHDRGLKRAA